MDLRIFQDRIYGKHANQLLVFEPTWDSFRPIDRVAWDGKHYTIVDQTFKSDLFDPNYGFGTPELKSVCKKLVEETRLDDAVVCNDPVDFWKWCGETRLKWWNDRPCLFASPCVIVDQTGWKNYLHYLNVRSKTLRANPTLRFTRRLGTKHLLQPK